MNSSRSAMRVIRFGPLVLALGLAHAAWPHVVPSADNAKVLRLAAVQMGLEGTLAENRDKIVRLTGEAAAKARLVVFPEGALAAPPGTPASDIQAALARIAQAAQEHAVYVVVVAAFTPQDKSRHRNQLHVFSPQGQTLLVYDKDAFADRAGDPRLVEIDGTRCSFIICSDRWSRPVESLPPVLGAQVVIECSNNYDTEWIPSLGWYWYVPRAIRNTAYVVFCNTARENRFPGGQRGHGHTAVIAPDGSIVAAAEDERDKIVTAELDLREATRAMAIRRSRHPLFADWWEMGKSLHAGRVVETAASAPPLVSSDRSVKCGFGLMACGSDIEQSVATICGQIKQAAGEGLDLVVFPELAVTGDREEDIRRADPQGLDAALATIRSAARQHKLTVVVGSPAYGGGKRHNSAFVIGPDGSVLTRYDQIVVSRPDLFQGGLSTKAMWFQVNGVHSLVTIGDDAIWNEMAELAALRGARVHCHLRHDRNTTPAAALRHDQLVASFASFRTLMVAANPLFPELKGQGDACFCQGAGIWDDLEAGNWCAVKTHAGRPWEKVFAAPRVVPGPSNPIRQTGYWRKGAHYRSWMLAGAAAMDRDLSDSPAAAPGRAADSNSP